MSFRDFKTNLQLKRAEAELKFIENSDEAMQQIKAFFSGPSGWIIAAIVVLLITASVLVVSFLSSVRAPELPAAAETTETDGGGSGGVSDLPDDPEDEGEIDDSNAVQPLLSGARKEDFYTFLLFGTDKEGTNTDTIMVVSYDVKNQKLSLMSIPRDTMVNVPWDIKKINSVYGMRGLAGFKKQIGKLIGFVPDYYVKIDLQAFVDVVDLIGGVEFDVPVSMHYHDPYQGLSIDLEPGVQTLNGEQAMGLVRFRKSDRGASGKVSGYDDKGRVQTQQAFLRAMFRKCLTIKNWTKITGYVEIFEKNVESDLTLGNMLWFARKAMDLGEDGFMTCTAPGNYYASAYSRATGGYQSYVTLYGSQMVSLVNESFNPYLTKVSSGNLDIMGVSSDGSVYSSTGYVADAQSAGPPPKDDGTAEDGEDAGDAEGGKTTEDGGDAGEKPPAPPDKPPTGDEEPPDTAEEPEPQPEPEPAPEPAPEPEPQPEPEPEPTTDTTPTQSGEE